MIRRSWPAVVCLFALSGCIPLELDPGKEGQTALVPDSRFGTPPPPPQTHSVSFAPATRETALRVDKVGREILAANPQIGLNPLFATIGAPQPEIFHQVFSQRLGVRTGTPGAGPGGNCMIHITEGLVKKCKDDNQLAALLCLELGKLVADRESMASPAMRNPEQRPPMEMPIGNAGQFSAPDLTRMAELAPYDRQRQQAGKPLAAPDPDKLARRYLERAGFAQTNLDAVAPLLAEAERNYTLEKQISGPPGTPNWTPHS